MSALSREFVSAHEGDRLAVAELYAELHAEIVRLASGENLSPNPLSTTFAATAAEPGGSEETLVPPTEHFAVRAAQVIRRLLVEHAQPVETPSRRPATTSDGSAPGEKSHIQKRRSSFGNLLLLGEALAQLDRVDPPLAHTVDLRFFCGLSMAQIATLLGIDSGLAEKHWQKARLWLHRCLGKQALGALTETGLDRAHWQSLAPHLDKVVSEPNGNASLWLGELRNDSLSLAVELESLVREQEKLLGEGFLEDNLEPLRQSLSPVVRASNEFARGPRYHMGAEHARGGMGRILSARDLHLERTVAIKELLSESKHAEARFLREAKLTAGLQHPSVVPVYDAGRWQESGKFFYSMKLVSGSPLSDIVEERLALTERLALLPNVLAATDAVAYAHSEGVLHRDLKPANILVGAYGETLVVDWGLAKKLHEPEAAALPPDQPTPAPPTSVTPDLTAVGTVMGTPQYMPPEQARGEAVDCRADVYSLGAILYTVLVGQPPYASPSPRNILERVLTEPVSPVIEHQPSAPMDLCAIVEQAMAREPSARYSDASELAEDLRRFLTGQMVSARSYSPWQMAQRWVQRHRAVSLASAAFLLLVVVGSVLFGLREQALRRIAEESSQRADAQSLALTVQRGLKELQEGKPTRASVFLSHAYTQRPKDRALQYWVSQAVAPLDSHVGSLVGHERDIVAVAFSPDGQQVATGSTDRTVRLWSAASGALLRTLSGAEATIDDVAWSPDGQWVASAENTICVWNASTGQLVTKFKEYKTYRFRFSNDGRWLAAGTKKGRLAVWDTSNWTRKVDLKPHADRVSAIAFHPQGNRAVTSSWDGTAILWQLPSWTPVVHLSDHHEQVMTADFSPDGHWLLTGDNSGTLSVREAEKGRVLHNIRLPPGSRSMSAFFTPDAKRIVTGSFDGLLRIWHAASGSLLSSLDANLKGRLFDVAYSPDGQTVATVGLREGNLWRLDRMPQPRLLRGHHHAPSGVYAGVLSANGERLVAAIEQASGEHPSTVHVWNTLSGKELGSWRIPEGIYSSYALAASADLSRVVTGYGINMTWLWEAPSGRAIAQLPHSESYVRAVSISPDGQRVVSGGDDGKLHVWSGVDGTSLGTLTQYKNRLTALDISPDGRRVASTESVGILRVHDLMTHQKELEIKAHPTWIEAVEFSRDGRRLVTSGRQDHTAKVWDALSGQLRATLEGHDDGLTGASFSPDSSLIATVSEDNTARLWDAESGAELRVIHGPAFTARFSPNGQSLVTTGRGDYVATWDVTPDFRSPSAISALVGQASPWVQRNGKLVPREPN